MKNLKKFKAIEVKNLSKIKGGNSGLSKIDPCEYDCTLTQTSTNDYRA